MHRSGAAMAWNVFRFCTALRGLGSIMILLVLGVVGVTYYAVVYTIYFPAISNGNLQESAIAVTVLLLFHCLLIMLLWSYFSVVLTDPGSVPLNWRPAIDEERNDVISLAKSEYGSQQSGLLSDSRYRYCRKCNQFKPPRCHHCSVCGRCVLKMDHHCVWVVNCVGALNYKFFLLFLFYTFLETTLVTLSLLPHFIKFFSDGELPESPGSLATTFLSFVLNMAFAVSVLGFLIMHVSLVSGNTTTIEGVLVSGAILIRKSIVDNMLHYVIPKKILENETWVQAYEKKTTPKWRYDLGKRKNFEQVFGADRAYWFIPKYSEEDRRRIPAIHGFDYPSKPELDAQEL